MEELIWPKFIGKQVIDLKLDRVFNLLSRLGNPQDKLDNIVHVAGTNGKGSTIAYLERFLSSDHCTVNVYTSPHLVHFNERIALEGKTIAENDLTNILKHCKTHEEQHPQIHTTFFEGTTVAAFQAFSQTTANYNLIETGLGGRLDATNVFKAKLAAIITPIDFDHMEFLGNNLQDIALEKIAIAPNAENIIIAKQQSEIIPILKNYLSQKNIHHAKFYGEDFSYKIVGRDYVYSDPKNSIKIPVASIPLEGEHQLENLTVAISAFLQITNDIAAHNLIKTNIKTTSWPARIQKIVSGKFTEYLSNNSTIYLDGGHNIHAATALANWLQKQTSYNKIKVLFSMAEEKDTNKFLNILAPHINELCCYKFNHERAFVNYREIESICNKLEIPNTNVRTIEDYFEDREENCLYLICGSLFLAGEVLRQNIPI